MATQDDEQFLRRMEEQLEGYIPGLPEQIDKLNEARLGRAIVLRRPAQAEHLSEPEMIGYTLPTGHNQLEHVLIFNTGVILVSSVESNFSMYTERYLKIYGRSEQALEFSESSIGDVIKRVTENANLASSKILLTNNTPDQASQVLQKVDEALKTAAEYKSSRDSARQVVDKLEGFFNQDHQSSTEESSQ